MNEVRTIVLGSAPVNNCQRAPANSRGLLQDTKALLGVVVHAAQVLRKIQRETTACTGESATVNQAFVVRIRQNVRRRFMPNHRKAVAPPTDNKSS